MQHITSVQNPRIQELSALRQRKTRLELGRFLVEGEKMVAEALLQGQVTCLIVEESKAEAYQAMAAQAESQGIPALLVSLRALEKISDTKTPQGIAAELAMPEMPSPDALGQRIVVLDGVQDPGNVGTILRTADAVGASGLLLISDCADPFSPKALRATMGSIFRVPIAHSEEGAAVLARWRQAGYAILSAELGGEDFGRVIPAIQEPWALIIGSEAHGVSQTLSQEASHRVTLPMRGGAESLNAAVAAGILLYGLTTDWHRP